jgi:hypothetical protein
MQRQFGDMHDNGVIVNCLWEKIGDDLHCVNCGRVYPPENSQRKHQISIPENVSDYPKWNCNCNLRPAERLGPGDYLIPEERSATIDKMRISLATISGVEHDDRLAICEPCGELSGNGCMSIDCSCDNRWGKWRKRIIAGECKKFPAAGAGARDGREGD